jgi:hypothetical protein
MGTRSVQIIHNTLRTMLTEAMRDTDRSAASGASRLDPDRARFGSRLPWLCDITGLGEPQPPAQRLGGG